jgi:hypothetical protein
MENNWDEIDVKGENKSIFKESLNNNDNDNDEVADWESIIVNYINNDVDEGYGWVTLDKMRDSLLHKKPIKLSAEELHLVIVYILKLETAVAEGVDEINN